jgi:hypothetical protein
MAAQITNAVIALFMRITPSLELYSFLLQLSAVSLAFQQDSPTQRRWPGTVKYTFSDEARDLRNGTASIEVGVPRSLEPG